MILATYTILVLSGIGILYFGYGFVRAMTRRIRRLYRAEADCTYYRVRYSDQLDANHALVDQLQRRDWLIGQQRLELVKLRNRELRAAAFPGTFSWHSTKVGQA